MALLKLQQRRRDYPEIIDVTTDIGLTRVRVYKAEKIY